MRAHLYNLKNPCPDLTNQTEMTDAIRECVLANRVYVLPKKVNDSNHVINNYNTIINYIGNMDTFTKIHQLLAYKNAEPIDFETQVEELYKPHVRRLQNDSYKVPVEYKHDYYMDIIHKTTSSIRDDTRELTIDDLNVVYNKDDKRVYICVGSESWEPYTLAKGVSHVVDTISANYLAAYEVYLIRKIEGVGAGKAAPPMTKPNLSACLDDYYAFISTFGVHCYVQRRHDNQIIYNEGHSLFDEEPDDDPHRLVDKYTARYAAVAARLTEKQKQTITGNVVDIIKTNSCANIRELNKSITNIIKMDQEFKERLLAL
jgi:hypothetical protein